MIEGVLCMNIKNIVTKLIKKYGTNDPFQIAKQENIHIIYIDLGGKLGNHVKYKREKFILIDKRKTTDNLLKFVCAHELGHALCTPKENTQWLKTYTMSINSDKIEKIANTFAVELLLPDIYLQENSNYSIYNLATAQGIPKKFIHLKNL